MIELVVDDEVIEVPDEMTLGIYQSIQMNKEFIDENPKHLIALFTGLPFPVVKDMTVDQVQLVEAFLSTKMELPEEIKLTTRFTFRDVEYGLENEGEIVILIEEYQYHSNFRVDQEINIMALFSKILKVIK
jgi:hypothetical protein